VIVCHDTELARPEGAPTQDRPYPVKRAIEQFCDINRFEWTNIPYCWGLGIVKVG